MKDSNKNKALEILKLVKLNSKLSPLTLNVDPTSIDVNPWTSNFAFVSFDEDEEFCRNIAQLLGENKNPKFVAIMRSVRDPQKLIKPFHAIHMDSRQSDKTLMVLAGDPDYSVFAKTEWSNFSISQRLVISATRLLLVLIETLKLKFLQGRLSHRLPVAIRKKVYKSNIFKNKVTGELIKFNNMLPHHSHPQPTQFSVLLQVVYD
jgi:hypothetical protein